MEKELECDRCGDCGAERQRRNTAYINDEYNFVTLCPDCMEIEREYWEERWEEYYHGCM